MKIPFAAKIYITDKPEEARYKNSSFIIPGVMKVKRLVISKTYYSAKSALHRSLFKVIVDIYYRSTTVIRLSIVNKNIMI